MAGAFLGTFAGGGMQSFTFGVFMKPMSAGLGWTRGMLTAGLTLRTLSASFLGPVFGPLVDRYGPRYLMLSAAVTGGVACLLLSRVEELWQFYIIFALVGMAGGAGLGGVVAQATVVKWFVRRRGRAVAFSTMGNTAAGALLAPLVGLIILQYDWRSGWLLMAGVFFILLLPVSLLMVRQPEDVGLLPDDASRRPAQASSHGQADDQTVEESWRLGEAVRTRALWLLSMSLVLGGLSVASVVVHEFSYVTDRGFSTGVAAAVLSTHAITASAGRLVWGFLVERFHVRLCMFALYLGCALGIGILLTATTVPMVFLFAAVYGICVGGHIVLSNVAWADYFGREFVGTIRGVLAPLTQGSVALGPLLVGLGYDFLGDYFRVFIVLLGLYLVAAMVVLFATPPVRQAGRAPHPHSSGA